MLPKKNSHSDEEDVLTLIYAVADAMDVASEIRSPALRRKLEAARLLLQASYSGLLHAAREFQPPAESALAGEAAAP